MDSIIFGCSITNKSSDATYNYYLYSRADNYAIILREKQDGTEWLFRVIVPSETIATVWANATTQTYLRPDALSSGVKKYIVNKFGEFINVNRNIATNW